jgi:hypothetical protein
VIIVELLIRGETKDEYRFSQGVRFHAIIGELATLLCQSPNLELGSNSGHGFFSRALV